MFVLGGIEPSLWKLLELLPMNLHLDDFLRYASLYAANSYLFHMRATIERSINRNAPSRG
jgi:hypothetical protein